jgi:hypothetical protein
MDKNDRSRGNRDNNSRRPDGRDRAGGRTSCKGFFNDRARRRDDDNDDTDNHGADNDRRGLGNLTGASFWGFDEEGPVRRERTRSPPRRDYTRRGHVLAPTTLHTQFADALQRKTQAVDPTAGGLHFISRAHRLLERAGNNTAGDDAWSGMVPLARAFNTLRASLHQLSPAANGHNVYSFCSTPSVEEVAAALSDLELQHQPSGAEDATQTALAPGRVMPPGDGDVLQGVDNLFTTPPAPILQQPAARKTRRRRTFDMAKVRRSARLAVKPSIPAVQKAQRNLCRKLGIGNDDLQPLDDVLKDFVAMFQGPLPEHVVAALTALFGLDDDGTEALDDALLHHAGQALPELRHDEDVV